MIFKTNNLNYNAQEFTRKIGYHPLSRTPKGELNCVRPLQGSDYPRFHVYLTESPEVFTLHIHLDQKKPSYEGSTAHGGDYESETVRQEVERIRDIIHRSF
jgi:hypothetical protein